MTGLPNEVGDPAGPKTVDQWFNTAAFVAVPSGTFGNELRNTLTGPGRQQPVNPRQPSRAFLQRSADNAACGKVYVLMIRSAKASRYMAVALLLLSTGAAPPPAAAAFEPGTRVLLDAHNCYPYNGRWADRIDRALSTGTPLAIEQDLVWFRDPRTGAGRSLVAHDEQGKPNLGLDGSEPTMKQYFFERIRPIVERALRENRRGTWPIVTLNLDLKTEEPEHLAAIWALLTEYKAWLTTAPRTAKLDEVQPLTVGPVLVLTGESDNQRKAFYDALPIGEALLVFGAAKPRVGQAGTPAEARVRGVKSSPISRRARARTITAGGTTPGASSSSAASGRRARGRLKTNRG